MEIALYARVSTERQQQTQTIEQQLTRLQAHVAQQPSWHLAEQHIYRDDGYSGAKLNRPGLDRLRDHGAFGEFELVLITDPDRLARKYVHQVLIIEELTAAGCQVEFLERPMNDDPHDQLLLQIRGAFAEYERTLIAERMRRGRQAQLRTGRLVPWTRPPYGYLADAEHPRDANLVRVDPVTAAVVVQIFAWYTQPQERLTLYQTAKQLNDSQIPTPMGRSHWNASTVRAILCNPVYAGMTYAGRTQHASAQRRRSPLLPVGPGDSKRPTPPETWIPIPVAAIVTQETFDLAQARLEQNKQMARRNNDTNDYLLRGLVSCARCRLSCQGVTIGTGYRYYICRGRTDSLRAAKDERCTTRYAPAAALEALVWQDLCQLLTDPALITRELARAQAGEWLPQALQARRHTLQHALAQLERQQERLLDVYLGEIIGRDEFERKRQELTQSRNGLAQQLRQLEAQAQQQIEVAQFANHINDFCQRLQPTLTTLDFAQRRQLVELLIDRVLVDDDKVEIRYVIPTSRKGEERPFYDLRTNHFDRLAAVVSMKPLREIEIGRVWRIQVADAHRMQHAFGRMKALQPDQQGIGTVMDLIAGPTDHFRILADGRPVGFGRDPVTQRPHHGRIGRFGVDVIAQFNQLSQVRPGGEARIQPDFAAWRSGLLGVFRTEALVAGLQPLAFRLVRLGFRQQPFALMFRDSRSLRQLRLGTTELCLPARLLLEQPSELTVRASLPRRRRLHSQRLDAPLGLLNLFRQARQAGRHAGDALIGAGSLSQYRLDGLLAGADPLLEQFRTPAWMATQPPFGRLHQIQQARRRDRVTRMVLRAQPLTPKQLGAQADLSQLIPQTHFTIHVSEGRPREGLAGRAHRPTGQIGIQHQRHIALPQIAYRTVQKGLPNSIQLAFEHLHGLLSAGPQRATDPTGIRQLVQLPSGRNFRILDQRRRPGAEIGQVLDAGQQAQQELDQLLVRRVEHRLLGNRYLSQPFQQPDCPGKMPPDDDHRMLRRTRLARCQSVAAVVHGASSLSEG